MKIKRSVPAKPEDTTETKTGEAEKKEDSAQKPSTGFKLAAALPGSSNAAGTL